MWLIAFAGLFLCRCLAATIGAPAPVHKIDGTMIREWLVLGPFPSQEMGTDFLAEAGGEAAAEPKEGDIVRSKDGRRLAWTRLDSPDDLVDLERLFGLEHPYAVAYAYCELESDQTGETTLRGVSNSESPVWIEGRRVGTFGTERGTVVDARPVVPVQIKAGKNRCLIKLLSTPLYGIEIMVQPLPLTRAVADLEVLGPDRRPIAGASVQFYEHGKLVARVKADDLGRARVDFHPVAESYDLRAVAGDRATWLYGVPIPSGGRRTVVISLTDAVSITGEVQALDGSGLGAIVVQALRVEDPPVEPEPGAGTARSSGSEAGAPHLSPSLGLMPLYRPLPDFSETVLTTTNGGFRFVGLRPGRYRLRAHATGGMEVPLDGPESVVAVRGPDDTGLGGSVPHVQFRFADPRKGSWTTIPVKRGLRECAASVLHRGSDGKLWVGSGDGGVFSYDGVRFYDHLGPGSTLGQGRASMEGPDGSQWVGTDHGVSRFRDGIEHPVRMPPSIRPLVMGIVAEPGGQVWLGTHSGLFRKDGEVLETFGFAQGLPSLVVNSLLRTRDGAIWAGTHNGLARFEGRGVARLQPFQGFAERRIGQRLHQSRDGALWFPSYAGVVRWDGSNFSRLSVENGLPEAVADDIGETSDGAIWFASGGGLSRFDGTTVLNYSDPARPGDLKVRNLHVDGDDVIWCATDRGVVRFDPGHIVALGGQDGLLSKEHKQVMVGAIVPDPDEGGFLVGTEWGGVFRTEGGRLARISADTQDQLYRKIHRSRDGALWLGRQDGLFRFEQGRLTKATGAASVLAMNSDRAGNIWFGCGWQGGGLTRFDPRTGRTLNLTSVDGLPNDEVWALEPDDQDGMWIGTSNGLARYRGGKIEVWNEPRDLQVGSVMHLRHDPDGSLWVDSVIGSRSLKDGARYTLDPTNGLPRLKTFCSVRTADGIVWMGTDGQGLLAHDGRAVSRIDTRDGLPGNQVFCAAVMTNGALLLGGMDFGLVRFQPTRSRPSIRILEAQVGERMATNLAPAMDAEAGRDIRIRYQEIDLKTHAEKRQFFYRLIDRKGTAVASAVTSQREFSWVPKDKGTYDFEVRSIDRDLNYSEPARCRFRVFMPWYADLWVLVPGGAGVAGLASFAVFSGLRSRKNRLESERLREQMLAQERRARAALEESNRSLEVATKAKSMFLANMSHEIRTPLNAVLGFARILHRDRGLSPDQRQSVTIIERSGAHLLHLVNEVLDLSKIEAGRVDLYPTDFDLRQLVLDLSVIFEAQCREAGLAWRIDWDLAAGPGEPPGPVLLHGDVGKLRQVLINILGNAVKFTETGGVTLRVSEGRGDDAAAGPARPGGAMFVFGIEDTGPGMPESVRETVFDAFTQDAEGQRKGGTGLGLSIARSYIELMGGGIRLASEPGHGSRFTVRVPLAPATAPIPILAAERPRNAAPRAVRALVADDVPENREILRRFLADLGIPADVRADGTLALDALRTEAYDIAFMDIRMPGLNGVEVVEGYLAGRVGNCATATGARPPTRLVAVSASALVHEREIYTRKGFDAFLPKPFDPEELCRCLTAQLGIDLEAEPLAGPGPSPETQVSREGGEDRFADLAIDRIRLGRLFRDDAAEIGRFLEAFIATTSTQLAQIRAALDAGDLGTIEILSHRCRGTSANFGIIAMVGPMTRIEEAAIAKDLAAVRDGLGQAEKAHAAVRAAAGS